MAEAKKQTKTTTSKKTTTTEKKTTETSDTPRKLKLGEHKSKPVREPMKSGYRIFLQALNVLKDHWKLFAGILVIYLILTAILVGGLSGSSDLPTLKSSLNQVFTGHLAQLSTGLTLFTVLVGSIGSGGTTAVAGAYQTILLLVISLIIIWALRQVYAKHEISVRDAYYKGPTPLFPFVIVLLAIGVQLVPIVLGAAVYSLVVGGGIAITFIEKALAGLVFLSLGVTSIYMICSSIFALYIVTLPDMTPMKALRSARELVKFRRWIVLRKILYLPLALLVVGAFIMIPISLYVTPIATAVFFALTILGVAVIHSYLYALYRELL